MFLCYWYLLVFYVDVTYYALRYSLSLWLTRMNLLIFARDLIWIAVI